MIPSVEVPPNRKSAMQDDTALALLAAVLATETRPSLILSARGAVLLASAAVGAALVSEWHDFGCSRDWAEACDEARRTGSVRIGLPSGHAGELNHLSPDGGQCEYFLLRLENPETETAVSARAERLVSLAHDLRAPLQSLIIAVDGLSAGDQPDSSAAQVAALAQLALEQVRNLLEMSRMDAVSAHAEPMKTFDLVAQVQDIVRLLQPICGKNGNRIVLEAPAGPVWQTGAAHLIQAVLQNLITNANRFTQNGPILVRLAVDPANTDAERPVVLEVEDRGPGLTEGEIQILTRRITAVGREGGVSGDGAGYGLGLGIVSRAVDRLRGQIEISRGVECGTTFRISFPLRTAGAPEAGAPATAESIRLTGLRVLVVEDNPINLAILLRTLGDAGAVAEGVISGLDAVERHAEKRDRIDLILLDVTLPDIDGIEVARRIRAQEGEGAHVLIAGLTAHTGSVVHGSALAAGMDRILLKPVRPTELRLALAEMWSGDDQRRRLRRKAATGEAMLDDRQIDELVTELGREAALAFMRQALAEARGVLAAFTEATPGADLRNMIHSAIGATGLTGLSGAEYALRLMQADARAGVTGGGTAETAKRIMDETEGLLDSFAAG